MNFVSDFTQEFMVLFQAGGGAFVDWITRVIPTVICLMTAINSVIKLMGERRVENFTKKLTRFAAVRYTLVPVLAVLFLGDPMCYTFGCFAEEKYKPAYYNSCVSFLHPVTGLLPHANPGELFVYTGITAGTIKLNLPLGDLAVRYFIVDVTVILVRGILTRKIYFRLTSESTKEKENAKEQAMYRRVRITKGSSGWGGSLVLEPDETCDRVLCVTGDDIHPMTAKIAEMTEAETVDGFKTTVPDEQVLVTVADCGGTARCGAYPKKRINTVNLVPVGAVGPLTQYIIGNIYVPNVKEDATTFTDEEVKVEKAVEETKEPGTPETKAQTRKELAETNQGKRPGVITRIGIGMGQVVNKFFATGRESIEMVIKNVLSFMTFTSATLGIIQVNGLGNTIVSTIPPLYSTMPGMIAISLICGLPSLSPILEPGTVIAQVVGTLLGAEIDLGNMPAQCALPTLLAINARVGGDFAPVGLSLGKAEPEMIEFGVSVVLYSRIITGSLAVIIAFVFGIGMC